MSNHDGFLGARSVWLGVGIAALALVGWQAMAPQPAPPTEAAATLNVIEGDKSRIERVTRRDCLQKPDRVWAVVEGGVECLAYVTAGFPASGSSTGVAVVYLGGDIPGDRLARANDSGAPIRNRNRAEAIAKRYGVPVVIVGRPGIMGSTGFHMAGGMRDEAQVLGAGLEALKDKLSIRHLALAGQSGGARVIAQLLAMGRRDIACAAMGSGAYGIPRLKGGGTSRTNIFGDPGQRFLVPLREVASIANDPARRSFVIADKQDRISPFDEQKSWSDRLAESGHHVQFIEANATDPEHHGLSTQSIAAASLCARGDSDAEIRKAASERTLR
jgi:pimeloyl-ACP methyl ester carboxylesterase